MMKENHRFYLKYTLDEKQKETDELLSMADSLLEEQELKADGATNIKRVQYRHLLFQN